MNQQRTLPKMSYPTFTVGGMKQNPINHIAFVLDASSSMTLHASALIKVTDAQIAHLARRSKDLDQETRVSVYTFADTVQCVIFDTDVLRLPSVAEFYQAQGNTALIDAVMQSQQDLRRTATMYGDHAFLTFVLTDGEENWSRLHGPVSLKAHLNTLQDNETVGLLVPGWRAKEHARSLGFPAGNIEVWDATSAQGMEEAMATMATATDNYMQARASGLTNTRNVFSMDPSVVNHKTVVGTLTELTGFRVERVKDPAVIQPFIESLKPKVPFVSGNYYFPLIKREKVSAAKKVLIRHKVSGKVYGGPEARRLVGLPDTGEVSISPQPNSEFDVFIQSTSLNRKLIPGHDLLIQV